MIGLPVKSAFAFTLDKSNRTKESVIYEKEVILMKRTISFSMGKGSVNHNTRKFKAKNVDGEHTCRNVSCCNESIKKVYHELFDEALKNYNAKQTRKDRIIKNYY